MLLEAKMETQLLTVPAMLLTDCGVLCFCDYIIWFNLDCC